MNRFAMPVLCIVLGIAFLVWRAGLLPGSGTRPRYPGSIAEVQKIGFWKLPPEQQHSVRSRCVSELRALLQEANNRLQRASYLGDLATIYMQRNAVQDLMDSMGRAQNLSLDPTAEQRVIVYYKSAFGRRI